MALEGTLQDFSLADILQLIGLQRKTGILTLTGKEDTVSLLFDTGGIVGAESERKHLEDRLGHVLLKTGKVESAQLARMLRIQRETGQRLGVILLKESAITRKDLIRALELQVKQILFRLFRWADGHYHFSQSAQVEYDQNCFNPIPVEDILMEGLRILDEWPLIEKHIRSFELVYSRVDPRRKVESDDHEADEEVGEVLDILLGEESEQVEQAAKVAEAEREAERVTVSVEEETVYRLVNGQYTVQDVIDRSDLGEFETCKAMFELFEKELIQEIQSGPSMTPTQKKDRKQVDRPIAFALAVGLVGLAVHFVWTGWLLGRETALERALSPFSLSRGLERLHLAASQNRLARLEYAIRLHAMHTGSYPGRLEDLVATGLVSESALTDPWGTPYRYVLSRRNFQIRGVDGAGEEHPDLILTGRVLETATGAQAQGRLLPGS